jgi:3'-5' exoribonuclease
MSNVSPTVLVRELKALGTEASGRPFSAVLVVKKAALKTASNGNGFLSAELGDRTGSFSCTVFGDSPAFEALRAASKPRSTTIRAGFRRDSSRRRSSGKSNWVPRG